MDRLGVPTTCCKRPYRGRRGKSRLIVMIVAAVLVAATIVALRNFPKPVTPVGPGAVSLTEPEIDALNRLQMRAVAHLENSELRQATEGFEQILSQLPKEPSAIQNLAVSAVLTLEAKELTDAMFTAAEEAVEHFLNEQPGSAIAHFLRARVLIKARDTTGDMERTADITAAFQRAEALDPRNAVYPFERFRTINPPAYEPITEEAVEAITRAYDLAAGNLFVQLEYILALARNGNGPIPEVFAQIKDSLRPHLEGPAPSENVKRSLAEVAMLLERGEKAETLQNALVRLVNNVRPIELAQSDLRRIVPNPLEFVAADLVSVRSRPNTIESSPLPALRFQTQEPQSVDASTKVVAVQSIDYDLDGRLDVVAIEPDRVAVFGQKENGEWSLLVEAPLAIDARGMILADLDRDSKYAGPGLPPLHIADPDLVIFGEKGVVVLKNEVDQATQQRSLRPIAPAAGVEIPNGVTRAVFADLDHDGDLDVVFGAQGRLVLWSNRGDMTFDDISSWSQLPPGGGQVHSLIAVDWDRDVDIDILVASADGGPRGYLENLRHGHFRWTPAPEGFAAWADASWLDIVESDGNVSWDLVLSGDKGTQLLLTATAPPVVTARRTAEVDGQSLVGGVLGDCDNNGATDVVGWRDGKLFISRGAGTEGGLQKLEPIDASGTVATCDLGDLDNDGDLDLVIAGSNGVAWIRNEDGQKLHWLSFKLQGGDEELIGRINHFAIGSTIEIKSLQHYQAQVVTRPLTHFGLGNDATAAIARIIFPNGVPQSVIDPKPDQVVQEKQRINTSCPFLYTWDGERFVFCTDLLWNAPLGLQTGGGGLMPDRPWEYLKIDGTQLAPRDGKYELRITEELWEATYLDRVELLVVDHPEGTEIYSNEKVGPESISAMKIHTVRNRRTPSAARDSQGRDLLPTVRSRDQQFAQPFDRTFRQGLAEPHFVELDLGPLESPKAITLFLTGWIFPTDCNLNVQLDQHPTLSTPEPPSIWVADGKGGWVEALPFMGFPSGKTKTIAIDLSGRFPGNDYRLQIRTSMALRWDEIFFTADDEPCEVRVTPARLRSAELRYRGFCAPSTPIPGGPETFDYDRVTTVPIWPPMRGNFTRYGDVLPLLTELDDQMVIFGAGDDLAIAFDALPAPPTGWKRDYLIHNDGWEKDCLLNTVLGQTVEPLPFREMQGYPHGDAPHAASPEYQNYLREYQTRTQSAAEFWRQIQTSPDGGKR